MALKMSEKEFKKLVNKKETSTIESRPNKFKNKKIKVDGLCFDSTKEYERYCELSLQEKSGLIKNLRFHHPSDKIVLIDDPLVTYIPDFCYEENNQYIVEDFKGFQTKEFILKKKMIISMIKKDKLNITFRIVKYQDSAFYITEEYKKNKT